MEEVKKIDTELEQIDLNLTPTDVASGLKVIEGNKEKVSSWKIDESRFNPTLKDGPNKGKFKIRDLDKVCQIIVEEKGIKTAVSRRLGISVFTIYKMIERHEQVKKAFEVAEQKILDFCESALMDKVLARDTACILFLLKTKGRHRGYREDIEIVPPDKPVFIMKKKEREDKKDE